MPRPRRAARDRRPAITEGERRWAYGEPLGEYAVLEFFTSPARLRAVWEELRAEVVAAWVEENAGTRPSLWWEYDAPEPRRRLGGSGDPAPEVLAHVPRYVCGIPADWFTEEDAADYKQALRNHTHKRRAVALDADDPPFFESEAAYLDRLGLLSDEERSRLAIEGWPEPEAIEYYEDPETATSEPPTTRKSRCSTRQRIH